VLDAGAQGASLRLVASYASDGHRAHGKRVELGQGLVGQCAVEKGKILLAPSASSDYRIVSGLFSVMPHNVLVLPIVFEGQVKGVIELASVERFNPTHQAFLDQLTESIGIVINTIEANMRTEDLLKQSQSLAHELQNRQEELQQTNEELQEKARLLAHQNQEVERKNSEVEQARQALEDKAKQLALTSKYKSEFLANMSHELRTPLNSLLILSDQLCRNPEGNLSSKQIEFAKTIHSSGNDLLMLINDILDLSKIESGTVVVDVAEHRLADLTQYVERTFRHVAEARSVEFFIELGADVPSSIVTDLKRLQQILKNLLSNAFKFTHRGHVTLTIDEALGGWSDDNETLDRAGQVLAFSVRDTGIGISADKQQIVFEAFQQADGSTSRKYGGTGLGLAISRELSKLLGGEIRLTSTPGKGSTFTLYMPRKTDAARTGRRTLPVLDGGMQPVTDIVTRLIDALGDAGEPSDPADAAADGKIAAPVFDDRDNVEQGDRVLLIVENDVAFARVMVDAARERGLKALATAYGAEALTLADQFKPDLLTLDLFLPDMDGWRVLGRLKNDLATRHIPVCVISTDESRERALRAGAFAFVPKPIESKEVLDRALSCLADYAGARRRTVLVALPAGAPREMLVHGLQATQASLVLADSRDEILAQLASGGIDAAVLKNDAAGLEPHEIEAALRPRRGFVPLPIVVSAADGAPAQAPDSQWERAHEGFVAHQAASPERLFDLCIAALHIEAGRLAPEANAMLRALRTPQRMLDGRKALIVDDDMRN
ncbi:MAG TPA: ATP-binding protein, partial [Paraburkholderia sp.]